MHSVFVSYRRADAAGYAGRLHDRLVDAFGHEHVFMDIDSISYGEDFVDAIARTLAECDVVLVLLGPNWIKISDANGSRRLDNPLDNVRVEVATALELGKRVIPVLVGGAVMPDAGLLPASLVPLSRRNAIDISDRRFNKDAQELIEMLKNVLARAGSNSPDVPPAPAPPPPFAESEVRPPMKPSRATTRSSGPASPARSSYLQPSSGWRFQAGSRRLPRSPPRLHLLHRCIRRARSGPTRCACDRSDACTGADPGPATAPSPRQPAQPPAQRDALVSPKPPLESPAVTSSSPWLTSTLYGSDNDVAALRKVSIRSTGNAYKINIQNQFNFECELLLNRQGDPASLSNCVSRDQPSPICNPDMPDSLCATSSGCFKTRDEKNPACFQSWVVKESTVPLQCTTSKTEQVCRGKYTLATTGNYSSDGQFTIARRLR